MERIARTWRGSRGGSPPETRKFPLVLLAFVVLTGPLYTWSSRFLGRNGLERGWGYKGSFLAFYTVLPKE